MQPKHKGRCPQFHNGQVVKILSDRLRPRMSKGKLALVVNVSDGRGCSDSNFPIAVHLLTAAKTRSRRDTGWYSFLPEEVEIVAEDYQLWRLTPAEVFAQLQRLLGSLPEKIRTQMLGRLLSVAHLRSEARYLLVIDTGEAEVYGPWDSEPARLRSARSRWARLDHAQAMLFRLTLKEGVPVTGVFSNRELGD